VDRLPNGVTRVRAANPSPMTLDGTNTYLVEGWAIDPGPAMEDHVRAVDEAAGGELRGIVLTHGHFDHADAAPMLAERAGGVPVLRPGEGDEAGPFEAVATPGHSPDSVCLLWRRVCFTGDTVLGAGSVFISPGEGSLSAYLDSLRRLRALDLEAICPGHGPVVWEPAGKLDEYLEHRLERERKVVAALEAGARTRDELLDRAWDDVEWDDAGWLRQAAALTLEAHLEKLREEGRAPPDVAVLSDEERGIDERQH
jgi:glyoxylase-like metal-dependent hydrolase (beta-lactamase superfamily II)